MTTGNTFQDYVVGAFKAMFDQAVNETSQTLHYLKLGYTDDEISVENEQRNQISGPSPGVLTGEGVEYGEIEKYKGFPINITTRKFALSYSLTEEVVDALQRASNMNMTVNEVTNAASNLVAGLNQNIDTNAADVFYLGFGTTSSANSNGTVGNSEGLFGSHALSKPGASPVRNTFAAGDTHRALASDSLRTGFDILNRYRSHADVQLNPAKQVNLVVSVELGTTAHRLLKSDYGPDSANLGINPVSESALASKDINIRYTVNPYIGSAYSTYWFLVAEDRAKNALKMGFKWKPRLAEDLSKIGAGTRRMVGSTRFRPIVLGWDWAFGSQGNNNVI